MTRTEFLSRVEVAAPDALSRTVQVGGSPVTYVYAPEIRERFKYMNHEERIRSSSFVMINDFVVKDSQSLFVRTSRSERKEMRNFSYRDN